MSKVPYQLHPRMRLCEAASPVIAALLETLFAHEAGTRRGDDAEALHDMRVASRRLRAALAIFAPCFPRRAFRPLQKETARLTRALGSVRDADVILEELRDCREELPAEEAAGLDDLIGAIGAERDARRARMIETLDTLASIGFRQRMRALIWADHAAHGTRHTLLGEAARRIGVRRIAELYGLAPYIHDRERVEELHELRKAAKDLRYSLEIFQPCYGSGVADRIDEIKRIQDQVGKIHDCDVLIDLLREHLEALARREHERLVGIALEPRTPARRLQCLRDATERRGAADPRLGILALLGRKGEERDRRYAEFVRWWDARGATGLRDQLYACVAVDR